MGEENSKKRPNSNKNWLEWTVFAVSLLLVLSTLTYLVYIAFTHKNIPPELFVEGKHEPSIHTPNRYLITLHNKGGQTAEGVLIELKLTRVAQEIEKAELIIPFIPQKSKRQGWVEFTENINPTDTIKVRVVSFLKP